MTFRNHPFILILAGWLLAACSQQPPPPQKADVEPAVGEIAWFDGSVDEAFAYARAQGKPVFLYWGAAWCPPCHEIKATVFRSREFVERSRLFVPVYLDGDTENAQALGERFGVVGYPTMLVFSPDGIEITRIPGGIDIQAYANVLDLTLASTQPVSALLARALDEGAELSAAECRLTAYYSWEQNEGLLGERDRQTVFSGLADACPDGSAVERSMLRMAALDAAVDKSKDKDRPLPMSGPARAAALALVNGVLDDERLVRANLYAVLISGASITAAVTAPGSKERAVLQGRFLAVLDRLEKADDLFTTERLYTAIGRIRFERIDDPAQPLPAGLQEQIRAMVARADSATTDAYERQSVMNAASNVLDEAGMKDDAKRLLLAEIDRSRQPYYFMVGLADIEQQAGNYPAAIDWLKQAYDAATGPATRFQWGNYYLNGLIEMTPDDIARIETETVNVVRELEQGREFYQRPKAQLQRLEKKLQAWGTSPERKAGLALIRQGVAGICGKIPQEEPARATCEGFLAPA